MQRRSFTTVHRQEHLLPLLGQRGSTPLPISVTMSVPSDVPPDTEERLTYDSGSGQRDCPMVSHYP